MDKLRFGICGLGFMGRSHFVRLRGHPQADVVAVCDQDAGRRSGDWHDALGNLDLGTPNGGRVSFEGVRGYATPAELIRDKQVDVVLVALPTHVHAEVAVAALQAGKHVFTEKPMAYRVGDCDRMIRAAQAAGRTLMVGQCIRFWPQYVKMKELIEADRIGPVRGVMLRRIGSPPTWSAGGWLLSSDQSGGALLDLHVHDIDFAHYLLGVPDLLTAHGTTGVSGGIDHVVALYGYDDGRYAQLEGGWVLVPPFPFEMSIVVLGARGTLEWSLQRGPELLLHAGGSEPERIAVEGDALRRELDYFIDCVRSGQPVTECSPTSTRVSIALAWLTRRAVETKRQVRLSERLHEAWGA